jgi:peptidoglycan/LPS O-acetylase OafA/YrhL
LAGVTPDDQRPADVDTGFWLWTAALPLLVIGYIVNTVFAPMVGPSGLVLGISAVFLVAVSSVVIALLVLLRQGYRWARTLLTCGGFAAMVYTVSNLSGLNQEQPAAAMGFAVAVILGSVLVAGGIVMLHRKDANAYFTR